MKRTFIVTMVVAALLAPTAALAQTDDSSTDRADQVRDAAEDQVRDLSIDDIKRHALAAIDKRVDALGGAIERVEQNRHVEPDHARALIDDYQFHIRGLESLVEPIEEAETVEELRPLVESIVVEHWVFALQIPKGMLIVASDSITDATEHFADAYERIQNALAQLAETGIELPEAEELLSEAQSWTDTAAATVAPIPDTVLSITVEQMPGARETLEAARADVRSAHGYLVDARENVQEIIRLIKDAVGSDELSDAA